MRTTAENSQIQKIHNSRLKILHASPAAFLYNEIQADSSLLERDWRNEHAEFYKHMLDYSEFENS